MFTLPSVLCPVCLSVSLPLLGNRSSSKLIKINIRPEMCRMVGCTINFLSSVAPTCFPVSGGTYALAVFFLLPPVKDNCLQDRRSGRFYR